jgi:hypothetical protein
LFLSIYLHWKEYQKTLLQKAKDIKDGVVVSGDGRHDSMGHSAKFCAYTIFCCSLAQIIHFDLVQVSSGHSTLYTGTVNLINHCHRRILLDK